MKRANDSNSRSPAKRSKRGQDDAKSNNNSNNNSNRNASASNSSSSSASNASNTRRVVAIVPMKHHSERVPGKNYRDFAGQPLYSRIIDTLLSVPQVTQVLIDTDSDRIAQEVQKRYPERVRVSIRPENLRGDFTPTNALLLYDTSLVEADVYLQTHCTNPLMKRETVERAISEFFERYPVYDSLFSVKKHTTRMWDQLGRALNHNPNILLRTQDLPPMFEENSCIYLFKRETLLSESNRIGRRPFLLQMDEIESFDIDNEWEFTVAEQLFLRQRRLDSLSPEASLAPEAKSDLSRFVVRPDPSAAPPARKPVVLVSAPYMIQCLERFRPILESFHLDLLLPTVHERMNEDQLLEYAGKFDGAITGDDKFTAKVIKACQPRLKVVSKWGTGVDSMDHVAAKKFNVRIMRTPDAFSYPVAESCVGYMLNFARKQPVMDRHMKNGHWEKIPGRTLFESTLGVIGCGDVGKNLLRKAKAFGMRLLGNDIKEIDPAFIAEVGVEMVSLDELLEQSDFVSVNCDLNPQSHHIMNDRTIGKMKKTAYLINTARGPMVEEAALVRALEQGKIAGAALDVMEIEPLPQDSKLKQFDNVYLAPHNSNSSPFFWEKVHWNTIKNLLDVLQIPYLTNM